MIIRCRLDLLAVWQTSADCRSHLVSLLRRNHSAPIRTAARPPHHVCILRHDERHCQWLVFVVFIDVGRSSSASRLLAGTGPEASGASQPRR